MSKIELGKTYRDTITGYVGMATGLASYLHGPPRVMLEGIAKDNTVPNEAWVDIARLELAPRQDTSVVSVAASGAES